MSDIKKLLNKKGWTGRELGIIELTNMSEMYRQALEGNPDPTPIVDAGHFQKMINNIADRSQSNIYNGYISIHEWLQIQLNVALSHDQQIQLQIKNMGDYITNAITAEDAFAYNERLPLIMTQKEHDEKRAAAIEKNLKDEDGFDISWDVCEIVAQTISHFYRELDTNPKKPNPLKPLKKSYQQEKISNALILSTWNSITGEGYYILKDGRRSDQMSAEEWKEATTIQTGKEATDFLAEVTGKHLNFNQPATVPYEWRSYEEPPETLTKWEALGEIDGFVDYIDTRNAAKAIKEEFAEAVAAVLTEIDKGEWFTPALSSLTVEEWQRAKYSLRYLYESGFYGVKEWLTAYTTIWDGNKKAMFNGIAIFSPSPFASPRCVDEKGYYVQPDIKSTLAHLSLEAFFTDNERYSDNADEVEKSREALLDSYYFLKGYNIALDLIADYYEVPAIKVFKVSLDYAEKRMKAFNLLVPILYRSIYNTDYENEEIKQRKLQAIQDIFYPLNYEGIVIPEENIKEVQTRFKDFRAFKDNYTSIQDLLCTRPSEHCEEEAEA